MPRLHYGFALSVDLDSDTCRQVRESIGAHATRGGWVDFTDSEGDARSILITPGIPIWIDEAPGKGQSIVDGIVAATRVGGTCEA